MLSESRNLAMGLLVMARTPEEREFVDRVLEACQCDQVRYLRLSINDRLYRLHRQLDQLEDRVRRILDKPDAPDTESFSHNPGGHMTELSPLLCEVAAFIDFSKAETKGEADAQERSVEPLY